MSFGFGVGDFVATAKLISGIVSILKRSANAPTEYKELEQELFGLQNALSEIQHLQVEASRQSAVNAIKCAALNCQYVLEQFHAKLSKYDIFDHEKAAGRLKAASKKLRESTALLSSQVSDWQTGKSYGWTELEGSISILQKQQAVQNTMLQKIHNIISSVLEPRVDLLVDMMKKVSDSNTQSTQFFERMGSGHHSLDLSHTWLQKPVRLEDPFGRYLTIPSEYSFDMMQAVIKARFKVGPGARRIQLKHFEISNDRNSGQVLTGEHFTGLIPGMQLRMAVLLFELSKQTDQCPIPSCGSQILSDFPGGGKLCNVCNVWFSLGTSNRKGIDETDSEDFRDSIDTERKRATKRLRLEGDLEASYHDDLALFKNVRLAGQALTPMAIGASQPNSAAKIPSPGRYSNSSAFFATVLSRESDFDHLLPAGCVDVKDSKSLDDLEPTRPTNNELAIHSHRGQTASFVNSNEHVGFGPAAQGLHRTRKNSRTRPSQWDPVLIHYLALNNPDIAHEAGKRPLDDPSDYGLSEDEFSSDEFFESCAG
ncbi:MAG: hypothetical protein Q9227_001121 [Pyrenula ochraceoflavens]